MKIAILADIHGNTLALDRVLADIGAFGGVDEYWLLGDLAALGPDPVGALERVAALPQARFVRGNTDRLIISGDIPRTKPEEVLHDLPLLQRALILQTGFAWTAGALASAGWLPWLERLPLDFRTVLPDGTRVLAVHASPGADDGTGIMSRMSDAEIRRQIAGALSDLIFIGHTHIPFDRQVDGVRVVNPGSVSNPFPPDLRASYALLEAGPDGWRIEHRRVEYDREAVIEAARQIRYPSLDYVRRHLRGEVIE